tara:strand:+ start:229 stop:1641 length:1413 start_codon:yes stop_codon:yes gene_type:complete
MKIGIIGGGTGGLVTALILKYRFSNIQIDLIKSDKIGIIGVGEGSTEHWNEFMNFCDISLKELLTETGATFKYGVMFEGWTKEKYFHNVTHDLFSLKFGQYLGGYAYTIKKQLSPKDYTCTPCFDFKIDSVNLPYQYHFDTFKLNKFLLKKCKEKGVNIIDDEIEEVNVKKNKIDKIKSKTKTYQYDLYVDSTGFKRLLISKLGAKWVSYKKYLPLNEAIAFQTPDTDEYNPYTLAKAMNAGWMWRIPTQGRWGNGYVFDNKFINAEEAKKECEEYLKTKVTIGKNIKFEAGSLDKVWIGNCMATGLSSSFIEPMEASSIGCTIQQAFILMHCLPNYESSIDFYNDKFKNIIENIRDFVVLHYLVKINKGKFWKRKVNLPPSLEKNLKKWAHRLPITEDFHTKYSLFQEHNFAIILKELNLVDKDLITKEFDCLSNNLKEHIKLKVLNLAKKRYQTMGHKEGLQLLKNSL